MSDGTVRGCVWGAASVLVGWQNVTTDLTDRIEACYQRCRHGVEGRRGVDYVLLAALYLEQSTREETLF